MWACVRELAEERLLGRIAAAQRIEAESRHREAIKAQALGEGMQVYRLEKLARYETHLDRKLERTLAMLVKLKELRGRR